MLSCYEMASASAASTPLLGDYVFLGATGLKGARLARRAVRRAPVGCARDAHAAAHAARKGAARAERRTRRRARDSRHAAPVEERQ